MAFREQGQGSGRAALLFVNRGRVLAERLWSQMVADDTTKKRLQRGETLCQMPTNKRMMAHFASWDTLPGIQNIVYEEQQREPLWPTPGDVHNFRYQMFVRWATPPAIGGEAKPKLVRGAAFGSGS